MIPLRIVTENKDTLTENSIGGVFLRPNGDNLQGLFSCRYQNQNAWERSLFIGSLLDENKQSRPSKYHLNINSLSQYDRFVDIVKMQFKGVQISIKDKREKVEKFFEHIDETIKNKQ